MPQPTKPPTDGGGECVDDESWCYGDCSPNYCAYVGQKVKPDGQRLGVDMASSRRRRDAVEAVLDAPFHAGSLARCKKKNTDGERSALEACPATCGTCP
jgi:hypothetical protein